jgi:hypothetical protein
MRLTENHGDIAGADWHAGGPRVAEPTEMTIGRAFVALGLAALAVVQVRTAVADSGRCFDFAVSTTDRLLVVNKVQRLVIQVENPGSEARQAAAALAGEAKKRGIEAVISIEPWPQAGVSADEHAAKVCRDNSAQLVAGVRFLTGTSAASVVFRDASGKNVESMFVWMTEGLSCPTDAPGLELVAPGNASSTSWYGWQLMIADSGSLLLLFVPGPGPFLSVLNYLATPAVIHGSNDQGMNAGIGVGLRLILPVLGALMGSAEIGANCQRSDNELCGATPVLTGLLIGTLVAMVIDDGLMAWKMTAPAKEPPATKAPGVSFNVGLVPYRQGAGVGLAGRF